MDKNKKWIDYIIELQSLDLLMEKMFMIKNAMNVFANFPL